VSSLNDEETVLQSPAEHKTRTVTTNFDISVEAMDHLVSKGMSERMFTNAKFLLLACGLYSLIQEMRDLQKTEAVETTLGSGEPNLPGIHRQQDLMLVGRYSQVALTHLETAVLWAQKAAPYVR